MHLWPVLCRLWVDAVDKVGDEQRAGNDQIQVPSYLNQCCAPNLILNQCCLAAPRKTFFDSIGQKLAHIRAVAVSASRHQADFPNSLFGSIFFPVCGKKFPVSIAGNSSREAPFLKGFVQAGRDVSREIPCIFPRIREFGCRDRSLRPLGPAS